MTMTASPFNAEHFKLAFLQVRKEGVPLTMKELQFKVQSLHFLCCPQWDTVNIYLSDKCGRQSPMGHHFLSNPRMRWL